MRRFALALGIILTQCGSAPAFGQNISRAEVFGGYSYIGSEAAGGIAGVLGFAADISVNVNKWFGIEGDIGVHPLSGVTLLYGGGPRFTVHSGRTDIFFHGLVGGNSAVTTALTFGGGIGVDVRIKQHLAVRVVQADVLPTEAAGFWVTGIRLSSGIVYTFGGTDQRISGTGNQATGANQNVPIQSGQVQTGASGEVALLGLTGYPTQIGFKITSVRGGSPATQLFLNPGDIVTHIDGREVHSNQDIEAAIAASTSGTIKVGYMFQTPAVGMMNGEREVKIR